VGNEDAMAVKKAGTRKSKAGPKPAKAASRRWTPKKDPPAPSFQEGRQTATDAERTGLAQGEARTVLYVHGIGNKPPADILRCQWDKALFGRSMGERTRLAYWVNRDRYPVPEPGTCDDRDEGPTLNIAEQRVLSALDITPIQRDLDNLADSLAESTDESAMLHEMLDELGVDAAPLGPGPRGILDKINQVLLKLISAALLQDTHDFFFDSERREAMELSLRERLESGGGPFVVIAHSQGSLVAYEVLRKLDPGRCDVALFVSLGSPLGLPSVRSRFKQWIGTKKLPFPPCVRHWYNVADVRDVVALDGDLTDDIERSGLRFLNLLGRGVNLDGPRNPHSASGYLGNAQARGCATRSVSGSTSRFPIRS
jgi:hypothetical protein